MSRIRALRAALSADCPLEHGITPSSPKDCRFAGCSRHVPEKPIQVALVAVQQQTATCRRCLVFRLTSCFPVRYTGFVAFARQISGGMSFEEELGILVISCAERGPEAPLELGICPSVPQNCSFGAGN